ncbi:MAG: hypothetical protein OXC31_20790 [Spirochaetaceae bacterium]|nr:hypothetical protein [Spirochaetaceae bacterium]
MTEAAAIVLLVFSFVTFLWAVVGLINPEMARLPHRLASVGVWAVSFAMSVFSLALMHESSDTPAGAEVATAPPLVVSPEELLQAFEENEVRAERTYRGQRVQVTGLVGSIEGNAWGGGGFIEFQGGGLLQEVEAHFKDRSVLADLSRHQRVTVVCLAVDGGNIMGATLRDCKLSTMETSGAEAVSEVQDAGDLNGNVDLELDSMAPVSESSDTPAVAEVASASARVVSQGELLQAFEENEVRAEQTYRGQRLQLTGLVGSIEGDAWGGGGFIEFQGGGFLREVEAHFKDGSVLADLSRHQRVTVVCPAVDGGNIMGVRLRDCELSRMEDSGATATEATIAGLVQTGHSFLNAGLHDAAAVEFLAVLQADPERRDVLFPLSLAQMKAGDGNVAGESFADLLDAGLPLELAASHNHAFGKCEGTFTLTRESVSYRSPRRDDPGHRFDVPLDRVVETGLRSDELLLIRAPSADQVRKNGGGSKTWTFRFDLWGADREVASLISGYLSAER